MSDEEAKRACRERVFRELVKLSGSNPSFNTAMGSLGFFTAMELVDTIVDAVVETGTDSSQNRAALFPAEEAPSE